MSITIKQLLSLPSLQGSEVYAGKERLHNIVSSISVLEYADPNCLQKELFDNSQFQGGEIVISALISIKDDVEAQCACIRRLQEAGEVGLILYYVGIFMKEIDDRVIQLADTLGFPIICMPKGRMDLRYSEVIQEVMESIIKDRMADTYFVSEMLERISHLPQHQRSMDSVLRMLSDRTRISYYLVDENYDIWNEASWPRKPNFDFKAFIPLCKKNTYQEMLPFQNFWFQKQRIQNGESYLFLIMIKEGNQMEASFIKQAQEVIQLFLNIWSKHLGTKRSDELIHAILQDEPVKMRHLAELLHIDVSSIHSMWMMQTSDEVQKPEVLIQLQKITEDFLRHHYHFVMSAIVKDAVVVFMGNERIKGNERLLPALFLESLQQFPASPIVCGSHNLKNTSQVRQAYTDILDYMRIACAIYHQKQFFTLSEIEFAKAMKKHIDLGEEHLANILHLLDFEARDEKHRKELLETLCVYYLDGDMHMQTTADILFLHKNTIQYRILSLQEKLHVSLHKMPEALDFYQACAIYRLLQPEK